MGTQHISDLVAENVRAIMARTRTKQSDLAAALGMTQGAVSKKVNGDRPFSLDELEAVSKFFGVPMAALLEPPNVVPFQGGSVGTAAPIAQLAELRTFNP